MTECEFCDFSGKRIFKDFWDEETVNGLYGNDSLTLADVDETIDPDEEINEAYDDRMRIAKTGQGYFLEEQYYEPVASRNAIQVLDIVTFCLMVLVNGRILEG